MINALINQSLFAAALWVYNKLLTNTKLLHSKPQCSVFLVRPVAEADVAVQCVLPTNITTKQQK